MDKSPAARRQCVEYLWNPSLVKSNVRKILECRAGVLDRRVKRASLDGCCRRLPVRLNSEAVLWSRLRKSFETVHEVETGPPVVGLVCLCGTAQKQCAR